MTTKTETKPASPWAWWRAALADPSKIGSPALPIHEGEYQIGYYRTRGKDKQWQPVGIYPVQGVVVAFRNAEPVSADRMGELFQFCCRYPVSYEAYTAAVNGEGWADEPPLVPVGDNSAEADADEFTKLNREYLAEKEQAEAFLKKPVTTQDQADMVAVWKKRFTTIRSKAEGLHKVEKQPHLDAGRAVDEKWRGLKEEPDSIAKRLGEHIKAFLQKKQDEELARQRAARAEAERVQREADEKARAARAEQERIQREADEAAAHLDVSNTEDAERIQREADEAKAKAEQEAVEAQRLADEAERDAEARKVQAGRTGAKSGLRTVKVGKVEDYGKAAAALVAMKHPDIIALIDTLANRAAKAGMAFDGMTVIETQKVV